MSDAVQRDPAELGTINNMQRLLELQRCTFLKEGTPDLKLRGDRLDRLAALLSDHGQQLAQTISADFGSRSYESSLLYDVFTLLESIKHAKRHLPQWVQSEHHPAPYPGAEIRVDFQPKGVVGVVSPWNFPVQLALGPVVGIIGAGNRALVKPSEFTPATSALLQELIERAFDEAELSVVTGGPAIAKAFTALPFDHLIYTGSTAVGRQVARAAADSLVPVTLELGGKSPVIIGASAHRRTGSRRFAVS